LVSVEERSRVDRRVRRTRRALRQALLDLMDEKGYDEVTVEEITSRADIGRTTFYLHYRAKQDLLLEQFGELVDELVSQLSQTPFSAWLQSGEVKALEEHPTRPISIIFQHAADNAEMYRIVLRGEGVDQASERLRVIMTNALDSFFQNKMESEDEQMKLQIPKEIFVNYFSGGLLNVIKWWLEADMPYEPEEMEGMIFQLLIPGTSQLLGLETK
jgi:AcrR family transcriptional regulator